MPPEDRPTPPLRPDRALRPTGTGICTSLAEEDAGAPYDRHARIYDRLIGSAAYNRLVWGTSPAHYGAFASEALGAGAGPFLDAGCGTAVFTGAAYGRTSRPLVLVDRSRGMLARASERLGTASALLVQADLDDLPYAPGGFETVGCFAVLHVLGDPWATLAALRAQVAPGGRLFASMLVTDRPVGRAYLRVLRQAGEVGPPRSAAEFGSATREIFGPSAAVTRSGSMAWLRAGVEANGAGTP